jgi:hypothetical protein
MSEVKHTPGPWKQDYPNSIISLDGKQIAITYNSPQDAKLIAASPDMYEIVRELYEYAMSTGVKGPIFPKVDAVMTKINS